MKKELSVVLAALAVVACGGSPAETTLLADCGLIMLDDEAGEFLEEAGIDIDTMCNCVLRLTAAGTAEQRQQTYLTFSRISEIIRDTGAGVEDTVTELMAQAQTATNDEDQQMLLAGIDLTETYFDQISESYSEAGQCPGGDQG